MGAGWGKRRLAMGDPEAEPSGCYKRQLCAKSGHIEGLAMTKMGPEGDWPHLES